MQNKIADGYTASVTLAAAAASGEMVIQGDIIGIAVTSGGIGDTIAINLKGAYTLDKVTGTAFTQGDRLLWDASLKKLTKTEDTDTTYVGVAYEDAGSADTTAVLLLHRPAASVDPLNKQAAIADVGALTVSAVSGNTVGDINGLGTEVGGHLATLRAKVNDIITALEQAGVIAS